MKYSIEYTTTFKKQYEKMKKQGKDLSKLYKVVELLAYDQIMPLKYKNHKLRNNKKYDNCFECHIEPDWLLVYKYDNDNLILLLFETGTHSELFRD